MGDIPIRRMWVSENQTERDLYLLYEVEWLIECQIAQDPFPSKPVLKLTVEGPPSSED